MYDFIKGKFVEAVGDLVVIEAGGLGYKIHVPSHYLQNLPQSGSEWTLYVCFFVRDTTHVLNGFLTKAERELFERLIECSGVGTRSGMAMLSAYDPADLVGFLRSEDTKALCRIPGIGKKTAERLVLEMRDKLKDIAFDARPAAVTSGIVQDAVSALINLGFTPHAAQQAMNKTLDEKPQEEWELAELIAAALRRP